MNSPDDGTPQPGSIALVLAVGLLLGLMTGFAAWTCYPPTRGNYWQGPAVIVGSVLALLSLYIAGNRRIGWRSGDWLVLGYALAMVILTGVVATSETVGLLQAHVVPATFGVPRG